ncbi:MAG TPA: molybdopterin converting factor subunit 1 [Burkholderiales bacterium]|jgi:molybdopterin synthase sulfur carrier subunit|nr:molybdopterin converting factor subunit 1 [Burkholderiales bacterium]
MVTVLYFARLREALGTASEQLALPESVIDLAGLRQALISRGGEWAQELSETKRIRAAVNQEMASAETPVNDGDEVAFFPPVTGG